MKKLFIFCAFFLMASTTINAAEKIDIQSVTNGTFAAKRISGIDPLKGTDQYAQISADGKQIVKYSFKTGKQTGVLFDVNNTIGESIKSFDGYIMSPDGKRMLIQTQTNQYIVARSKLFITSMICKTADSTNSLRVANSKCLYGRQTDCRWHSFATTTSSS